jgi:deoxyuridine 5'-triphosphate nucleotidohydrolase
MTNDFFFKDIDTPEKAYLLGLIIFNIKNNIIDDNKLEVEFTLDYSIDFDNNLKLTYEDYKLKNEYDKKQYIYYKNIDVLIESLLHIGDIKYDKYNNINIIITSKTIIEDIRRNVKTDSLNNIYEKDFSLLIDNYYKDNVNISNKFIIAYIEKYGNIIKDDLYISFYNINNMNKIIELYKIPHIVRRHLNLFTIKFCNVNMIDFLGLFDNDNKDIKNMYINNNIFNFNNKDGNSVVNMLEVYKDDINAVIPSKSSYSDAGYDLTIIKVSKILNSNTVLYDTGIKLNIPNGYYVEIVPRSSISRSGYMLANNVGIIDQGYRGNLFIALIKINKECDDLVLPWKCCQMIVKKQIYSKLIISSDELTTSSRGIGGFGSTDKKS